MWSQAALKREKLKHNMLEVLHIKDRIVDAQVDANAEFAAKTAALQEERKQLVERLKTVDAMLEQTRKQQVGIGLGLGLRLGLGLVLTCPAPQLLRYSCLCLWGVEDSPGPPNMPLSGSALSAWQSRHRGGVPTT